MIDAPSTRRRFAVVMLGVFALVVSACGTLTGDAASVGGTDVSDDDFREELASFSEFAELNAGSVPPEWGRTGESAFSMDAAVFLLGDVVRREAFGQILDELGGSVTDADRAETEQVRTNLVDNGWLDDFLVGQNRQVAVNRILTEQIELTYATPEEWFAANSDRFANVICARHILVATPEEAQEAYTRIVDGGEAFEDVAAEVGTDGSAASGGDLGCQPPETYVESFAIELSLLESGEVSLPFPTDFGWHVARVDATADELTYDDLADEVEAQYQADVEQERGGEIQRRLSELFEGIDVSVSSRYGVWDPTNFTVVNPSIG